MAESIFEIIISHINKQAVKNVSRQLFSNENMGKAFLNSGPIKRNEPTKKGIEPYMKGSESKKTFHNKSIQTTPMKSGGLPMSSVFSGKKVNTQVIYSDDLDNDYFEELGFTKHNYLKDDLKWDIFDNDINIIMLSAPKFSEPSLEFTPPPKISSCAFEYESSFDDYLFTDMSNDSLPYQNDSELPSIF